MPRCSLMSTGTPFFISKLKFSYDKYSLGSRQSLNENLLSLLFQGNYLKFFMISVILFKMNKHSAFHLIFFQIGGTWQDFTVVTKLIKNFKSLYGFGGSFLEIGDVCMDFEPYFKVHNLVSVHPKGIILGQMTNLNMIFHVEVSVYRLVKLWNSPQFLDELRNGQYPKPLLIISWLFLLYNK